MKIKNTFTVALAWLSFFLGTATVCAAATNVYVSQNATGAANGADCADAVGWDFFSGAGNWTPGTTFHICGTYMGSAGATAINVLGSGQSGNPITIKFEPGAALEAPYWGDNPFATGTAAILCVGHNYIVVDGGTNGLIENTNNGSPGLGYAYSHGSQGVSFSGCSYGTIQNLTVSNIYIHQAGSSDSNGTGTTICIGVGYSPSGIPSDAVTMQNNKVNNCWNGLALGYDAVGSGAITSATISGNTSNSNCESILVGDGGNNSSGSGLVISGNTIGPDFNTWIDSNSACHENGIVVRAANTGSKMSNSSYYNNDISASTCTATGGNFTGYIQLVGYFSGVNIFNNVLHGIASANGCQTEGLVRLDSASYTISNVKIMNNTFDGASVGGGSSVAIKVAANQGGSYSDLCAENNVFENFNAGSQTEYLNQQSTLSGEFGNCINYNDNWNSGPIALDYAGGSYYCAQASGNCLLWTTGHSVNLFPGYDSNGSMGNPMFNPGYVPQTGSAAINLGTNLTSLGISALNSDKAGQPRPSSGQWTAGALQPSGSGLIPPSGLTAVVN